jgi:hypothetical protein
MTKSNPCPLLFLLAAAALGSACGDAGDGSPAPAAPVHYAYAPPGAACPLALGEVALYQGVKVTLGRDGVELPSRSADVIEGRPGLLRVFVNATPGAAPVDAAVRVTLRSAAGAWSAEASLPVRASSTDGELGSTLNVDVPGHAIGPDTTASVELVAPAACAGPAGSTRFPSQGEVALRPLATGVLRVRLVPLRYEADGSGRLPDTSPAMLESARAALMAMFPVAGVELEVRPPVPIHTAVTAESGWSELLDAVRDARAADHTPDDVYTFGLVQPAATSEAYCGAGCISGNSYRTSDPNAALRVSVGLGYPGPAAIDNMMHELGHAHGRKHAPCGTPPDPDPGFPQRDGAIGGWGWDDRAPERLVPPGATDVMSYCGSRWISAYTFQALAARSAQVNVRR